MTGTPLLQRLNSGTEIAGCEVRIAERHLDIAMAGQRGDFRKRSSRLDQTADEGMPERMQTHSSNCACLAVRMTAMPTCSRE
jgi:hypothetical protein